MKILALALVAALAAAGCQSNKALVRIANPDNPSVEVHIGATMLTLDRTGGWWGDGLAEILKAYAAGKNRQQVQVVLQSDDGVHYEHDALVIYACYREKISNLVFGGVSVRVPEVFPSIQKIVKDGKVKSILPPPDSRPRIKIKLYEVGSNGEVDWDGKNDWVDIVLEEKQSLFKDGSDQESVEALQRELTELQVLLREKRAAGVPANMLVEIVPTMACKHVWVVQACKAVVAAGFTNIELAFPYE